MPMNHHSRVRFRPVFAAAVCSLILAVTFCSATVANDDTIRFDFETGDMQGWRVVEGKFTKLLNDREMFRNRKTEKFNKQGKYFLDTVEKNDKEMGVVESPLFTLTGPKMIFMIGGGKRETTYVALCDKSGKELLTARGKADEVLLPVEWNAPQLVGQTVFVRIVDGETAGWGHVTFDDFQAQGRLAQPKETELRFASRKNVLPIATTKPKAKAATKPKPTPTTKPLPSPGDAETLRAAIQHLAATYGERYPRADDYLKRLDALGKKRKPDQGKFLALQREALLASPLLRDREILFVLREQYIKDHHNTATLFQTGEINTKSFRGGSSLKAINLTTGKIRTLLASDTALVRDPEVHFDGDKIVFSMRRDIEDDAHIYEINVDGSDLRQLTSAPAISDIDPLYLPDGDIVFSSSREPKFCMCNRHIMANLFRMESDGANIHQIGKSTLFEGHTTLTPDGRLLYDRWEYVDRNFGDAQGLWTSNPDGTNHAVYWGNNTWSPGGVLDARVLPDGDRALCVFSSCHDLPWGALAIVDRRLGVDGVEPVERLWPANSRELLTQGQGRKEYGYDNFKAAYPKYEDPFPLSGEFFLCSRMTGRGSQMGLYLIDVFGNEILLHKEDINAVIGCFDPMPIAASPRPPAIPTRRDFNEAPGTFFVADVYEGTSMEGVERGAVKYLRVIESPEKRYWTQDKWGGQGAEAPAMNWHDFNNKRILGTVPVEADGSAHFTVPADKFVYFQLLDENGMMVQSMRSGTIVQPGEVTGCVGCHESRRSTPIPTANSRLMALARKPSKLQGWRGDARLFCFMTETQPVFNTNCVGCHDYGKPGAGKLVLAPDRTNTFNTAYNELWRGGYTGAVGAGPYDVQRPRSWGSHASRLVDTIRKGHNNVKLTDEEFDRIVTWLDLNAPYYPSYGTAYPSNVAGRSPLNNAQTKRLTELTGLNFTKLASYKTNRGPQISFDRPERSPCLVALKGKPETFAEALAIIKAGHDTLFSRPRADMDGFQLCPNDEKRRLVYEGRLETETLNRAAVLSGRKLYDNGRMGN